MSNIKLLLDVIADARSFADSLGAVADAMKKNETTDVEQPVEPKKETTDVAKPVAPKKEAKKPKEKEIKFEDVRALLGQKSQEGMTEGVRGIIQKYGATKLSEIEPEHYADVLKDAGELTNG